MNAAVPECVILAGPNGAGKSSLFQSVFFPGLFINADEAARELNRDNPSSASRQAGRLVLRKIDDALARRADFTYETTLSSRQSLNLLRRAKDEGYKVLLIFVVLYSADLHVARVQQRVSRGGHDIPEPVIRRRYDLAVNNLAEAIPLCDAVVVYDNSSRHGFAELLRLEDGVVRKGELTAERALHRRIAISVASGLNIPLSDLLSV